MTGAGTTSDQTGADQRGAGHVGADQTGADRGLAGQAGAGQGGAGQAAADQGGAGQAGAGQAGAGQAGAGQGGADQTGAHQAGAGRRRPPTLVVQSVLFRPDLPSLRRFAAGLAVAVTRAQQAGVLGEVTLALADNTTPERGQSDAKSAAGPGAGSVAAEAGDTTSPPRSLRSPAMRSALAGSGLRVDTPGARGFPAEPGDTPGARGLPAEPGNDPGARGLPAEPGDDPGAPPARTGGYREVLAPLEAAGVTVRPVLQRPDNPGHGGSHNALARTTSSDLLLLVNPDTVAAPTLLVELLAGLGDDPDPRSGSRTGTAGGAPGLADRATTWDGDISAPGSVPVGAGWAPGQVGMVEARQLPLELPKVFDPGTGDTPWASAACLLVRRALFEHLGGFDAEHFFLHCDDVDLSWRARLAGARIVHRPTAVVFHDKRLTVTGHLAVSDVEHRWSAEGALTLAHRYGHRELLEQLLCTYRAGSPAQRAAVEAFEARRAGGRLPGVLDPEHQVAHVGPGSWSALRFGLEPAGAP